MSQKPNDPPTSQELTRFVRMYTQQLSIRRVANALGWTYHRARMVWHSAVANGLIPIADHVKRGNGCATNAERKVAINEEKAPPIGGRLKVRATPQAKVPRKGVTRFLLTCAQNNTNLHEPLWENLQAFAAHYKARIMIARTVYNRFADAAEMDKKLIIGSAHRDTSQLYHWDERLKPYFYDERLELAPGLVYCGETNISPTAVNPLSGFEAYTGRASTVVPHNRIALRSVATHSREGTKLLYTTGTLTMRNYIQRKAGQMAEFHHCYGALLVEVDADGTWFCRQLNADSEGVIHDWDLRVDKGHVSTGNSIEAINWGDIHVAYGDPDAYALAWGAGGMLDQLRPKYQFIHDLIDFRTRNPHNITRNLNLQAFVEHLRGHRSVEEEMQKACDFLETTFRDFCETVVVSSNHDNWLVHWLERWGDFRKDPTNAVYFLRAALHLWDQTQVTGGIPPNMTQWVMYNANRHTTWRKGLVQFLDEDESFIICAAAHGGIEMGMHGHQGPNGARGTPSALAKMGRKANIGDKHSTGIYDGLYVAGIMGLLDQGYNDGPGSWTQSNILTYPNGKRAIQTIYDGKARA